MSEDLIILFDEHGTPTFREDRESQIFIGVGATFKASDREHIFDLSRALFGLDNNKPLKNRHLGITRINDIGSLITNLPITLMVTYLDLSNPDLQRIATLYEDYGNLLRDRHRGVSERPVSHILYKQVLDHSLFYSVQHAIEKNPVDSNIRIYLDDWSISPDDVHIVLDLNRESMELRSNEAVEQFFNVKISLDNFKVLVNDCDNKRYIDVITSVSSRAFLDSSDDRYSETIKSIFFGNSDQIYVDDITTATSDLLTKVMDQTAREGGPS